MISSSQRPLHDNTQHSQQTNIHVPGGIRTHNLSRRAAAHLRLRPRGHWDRHMINSTPGMNPRKLFFLLILYSLELKHFIVCPNSVLWIFVVAMKSDHTIPNKYRNLGKHHSSQSLSSRITDTVSFRTWIHFLSLCIFLLSLYVEPSVEMYCLHLLFTHRRRTFWPTGLNCSRYISSTSSTLC